MPELEEVMEKRNLEEVATMRPADGERHAMGGYNPQYQMAATLILRQLQDETLPLQWIRLADPEAGRVDDFQIGSQSRVDAFQVKWHIYGGNFTFNNLKAPQDDAPSLIAQLADGWKRLRSAFPSKRIVVHLVTNATPSVSDSQGIPIGEIIPKPRHFAAFIHQVWKPARKALSHTIWNVPVAWQPAWEALQIASGLSNEDFDAFVQDCELEFSYHLLESKERLTREQVITQRDLKDLTGTIIDTVADPQRIIELTRDELLARLDWQARFEFRSRHEFPVDELLYQPIEPSVHQLEQALDMLPGGYIAVLGTPGSGKSSLLTKTLRSYPGRVIRYYAYVPDAQDSAPVRGESTSFLHDVILALKHAGFSPAGTSISLLDREQLLPQFHHQLQLLHEDWQSTGHKTIILIDGLDHISRELHPQHSLLCDLPRPGQVPQGVYIVLGSQTDQLAELPSQVQYAIRQSERHIEMQPLPREAVMRVIGQMGFSPDLADEQKLQVYSLSTGHPLALAYLLRHLAEISDATKRQRILDTTELYEGDIEAQYHSYWRQFEHEYALTELLGLLARMRRAIDITWVRSWGSHTTTVEQLNRTLAHYFRREDHNRWYFFHNSFRLFLLKKTSESSPGSFDSARNREFHHELAERCAQALSSSPWSWEELYHRIFAEEYGVVLQRATPSWFRQQLFTFRPINSIRTDIQLALRSVVAQQDPVALTRLLLTASEMDQRAFHLEHTSFISLLLSLGEEQLVAEHVRDGNQLRIDTKTALHISYDLQSRGFEEEARRIFELAEPLDLLASSQPIVGTPRVSQEDQDALLAAWAKAASQFRDVKQIITTIRQLRRQQDEYRRFDAESITQHMQSNLLFTLGYALLEQQRWDDLSLLNTAFLMDNKVEQSYWFWLQLRTVDTYMASEDQEQAKSHLEEVALKAQTLHLSPQARVAIAESIYRIFGDVDQVQIWVDNLPQPTLANVIQADQGLQPFLQRFRLNRLLYALGSQHSPTAIVPDAQDKRYQGLVYFERAICTIAWLWAEGWRERELDAFTFVNEARSVLQFFHWNRNTNHQWNSWYSVEDARAEFFTTLIHASAQHGSKVIEALRLAFECEWDDPEKRRAWPADACRQAILAFRDLGASQDWAVTWLQSIEQHMHSSNHVSTRLSEYEKQTQAWLTINEREKAYQLLLKLLQASFTVGNEEDYQLDTWIHWLERINRIEPGKAPERIAWFARSILALEENTEGKAAQSAAEALLAATFDWSPRRAVLVLQWLLKQQIIRHEVALQVLLKTALKSDHPPVELILACLANIGIPFATEAHENLIVLLIEKTITHTGIDNTIIAAQCLFTCIQRDALPSARAGWLQGLVRGLSTVGIGIHQVSSELANLSNDVAKTSSRDTLELKNGSVLSSDEVYEHTNTIEDLQTLLEAENEHSYFDWVSIATHVAERLERQKLLKLADLFTSKRCASIVLSMVSKKLLVQGHRRDAWSMGERALEASSPHGWSQWYDRGTRLDSLEALVHANPTLGRSLVYETVLQDICSQPRLSRSITLSLTRVLPLLVDAIPVQEVWKDIEQYTDSLFESAQLETYEECDLSDLPSKDTVEQAMAELIGIHLGHPVKTMNQMAQRACALLLTQNNLAVREMTGELLAGQEVVQENLLIILESVSAHAPNSLLPLAQQIAALQQSPNYVVRASTRAICQCLGNDSNVGESIHLPTISAIYTLKLPSHGRWSLVGYGEIVGHEPAPDTQDPVEIVRPFDIVLSFVAQEAGFEHINVCYRAVQIMNQLAPYESWAAQGEIKLRGYLQAAGLKYPFSRPRTELARRALFHMIMELVDTGVFDTANLRHLEQVLRFYDPGMLLIQPTRRPPYILPIIERDHYNKVNEHEWLDQVDEAINLVSSQTTDGHIILAEETHLQFVHGTMFEELRQSTICSIATAKPPVHESWDRFFHTVLKCFISEYEDLQTNNRPIPLILRHAAYGYDSPGEGWLALNPVVGRQLGWHCSEDGLFRWLDANDNIMVESVWWKDGPVGLYDSYSHDECGEGWIVVANQEAITQISSYQPFMKRQVMVERECHDEDKQLLRRHIFRDIPV
jgi:hypothetical protein